jgi:5-methylcytosine-specific restriction endonuclease McrA
MKRVRPKGTRIKLSPDEYEELRIQVLQRDGWRCQVCGSFRNLEVHHQVFRSQLGDDSEVNLITLCNSCHLNTHLSTSR